MTLKLKRSEFEDRGGYYHSLITQGTPEALEQKKPFLTSTRVTGAIGWSDFENDAPLLIADQIRKKYHIDVKNDAVKHGLEYEDLNKEYYEMETGNKIIPVNLGVPKWDMRIASTPDGLIGEDGMFEAKCPFKKMYPGLLSYLSVNVKRKGVNHILLSHTIQMQTGMAVFDRQWCDYSVLYVPPPGIRDAAKHPVYFLQKVYFSEEFWLEQVYPMIEEFFDHYLPDLPQIEFAEDG